MTKCDFCTQSDSNGKCHWSMQGFREDDCKKAIKKMIKVLSIKYDKKKYRIGDD